MSLTQIIREALDTFEQPDGTFDIFKYTEHIEGVVKKFYPNCKVLVETHPDDNVDIEDEYEPEDFMHSRMVDADIKPEQIVDWYLGYDNDDVLLSVIVY